MVNARLGSAKVSAATEALLRDPVPSATVPLVGKRGLGEGGGRSEFEIISRLRASLAETAIAGEIHAGDDAAVLNQPAGKLLFATDVAVEGVHFDLAMGTLFDAGWKVLVANVSDIAAMGGVATHVVAGVAAPQGTDLDELFSGLRAASEEYGVALVGGDLSLGERVYLCVAILGETGVLQPVLRSGADPGDVLWCTGPLGASAAGLAALQARQSADADAGADAGEPPTPVEESALVAAYLHPRARPAEGRLAAQLGATAMIDVSDGLSRDLSHIADESGVGFALDDVPVAAGATEEQALGGGEDYELVFAAPQAVAVAEAFRRAALQEPIRIGRCVEEVGVRTLRGQVLPVTGWEHELDA